jgi:hypothetical protein
MSAVNAILLSTIIVALSAGVVFGMEMLGVLNIDEARPPAIINDGK